MAEYKKASCPSCGAVLVSSYRVDVSGEKTVTTHCLKCKANLTVTYGNGKVHVSKR